jgi:hypothetical protein
MNRCFYYAHPSLIHSISELRKNNQIVRLKTNEKSQALSNNSKNCYYERYKSIIQKIEIFENYVDIFSYLYAVSSDYDWKINVI